MNDISVPRCFLLTNTRFRLVPSFPTKHNPPQLFSRESGLETHTRSILVRYPTNIQLHGRRPPRLPILHADLADIHPSRIITSRWPRPMDAVHPISWLCCWVGTVDVAAGPLRFNWETLERAHCFLSLSLCLPLEREREEKSLSQSTARTTHTTLKWGTGGRTGLGLMRTENVSWPYMPSVGLLADRIKYHDVGDPSLRRAPREATKPVPHYRSKEGGFGGGNRCLFLLWLLIFLKTSLGTT